MTARFFQLVITVVLLLTVPSTSSGQGLFEFERKPIDYHNKPADNAITRLQSQLDNGTSELVFAGPGGYLRSLLETLQIPISSQALVFSKSSQQFRRITPQRPRALYFNDHSYVGWVQGGEVIEIITADAALGTVFYTLRQNTNSRPAFQRDRGQCLQCHGQRRTRDVPGPVVRSLFTEPNGQPIFTLGNFVSDHTSPFPQRWGGYYVTGRHGKMLHMGNSVTQRDTRRDQVELAAGANVVDLTRRFNTRPYLTAHSDIVALMVLEHQTQMQNLLTRASFEEQRAVHYDRALQRPDSDPSDLSRRRIARAGEAVVRYMLFEDEFPLEAPVTGTSGFQDEFSQRMPQDSSGRSLYQLDLKTRLFKYPLSYMIYSDAFRTLPPRTSAYISKRLYDILSNSDSDFPQLDEPTRLAMLQIVRETHPELSNNWPPQSRSR